MFTHKVGVTYSSDAGTITSTTNTYQADAEQNYDNAIAALTTNQLIPCSITVANIKSCVLYSDQAITIKTNSTTSPQDTISLAAKQQIVFTYDGHDTIAGLFTGNLTAMYVTNASSTLVANLKIRFLLNN